MRLPAMLLIVALLPACSCQPQPDADELSNTAKPAATDAPRTAETRSPNRQPSAFEVRQRQLRHKAMREAVAAVHGYLGEIGSGQFEQADARWAYRRAPSVDEEAGLRDLTGLNSLRIENGTPEPLDAEPVPQLLQVPVRLRAFLADGQVVRYRGWYRLRYNMVEPAWEITGASLDTVAP